jgi:hypothetical protein
MTTIWFKERRTGSCFVDPRAKKLAAAWSAGALLIEYRASLEALSASTINVRLLAIRKMVSEARLNGMVGSDEAVSHVQGSERSSEGNPARQLANSGASQRILAVPDRSTVKGRGTLRSWRF